MRVQVQVQVEVQVQVQAQAQAEVQAQVQVQVQVQGSVQGSVRRQAESPMVRAQEWRGTHWRLSRQRRPNCSIHRRTQQGRRQTGSWLEVWCGYESKSTWSVWSVCRSE